MWKAIALIPRTGLTCAVYDTITQWSINIIRDAIYRGGWPEILWYKTISVFIVISKNISSVDMDSQRKLNEVSRGVPIEEFYVTEE